MINYEAFGIDSSKEQKTIKGIICHFCKKDRIGCIEYTEKHGEHNFMCMDCLVLRLMYKIPNLTNEEKESLK